MTLALSTIISTEVIAAAPLCPGGGQYDLVSLEAVKEELEIEDGKTDRWIRRAIRRASSTIRKYCNRTFQVQTYFDQYYAAQDPFPWQVPSGWQPLQLVNWPIVSLPSPAGTAPPFAPQLGASAGGDLAAARYYVRISYLTAHGETAASLETNLAVAANGLLTVAAPGPDLLGSAIGWNVYVGTESFAETLQNVAPIGLDTAWTIPISGLIVGAPLPPYILAVENVTPPNAPPLSIVAQPLTEGNDFRADPLTGQLTRLYFLNGMPRRWPTLPIVIVYSAGFDPQEADIEDAAIDLVKASWFGRRRDPMVKSENIEGVWQADYWFGTGPGGPGDLPNYVKDKIERYRVPVIA
jgi:hypothetical protein